MNFDSLTLSSDRYYYHIKVRLPIVRLAYVNWSGAIPWLSNLLGLHGLGHVNFCPHYLLRRANLSLPIELVHYQVRLEPYVTICKNWQSSQFTLSTEAGGQSIEIERLSRKWILKVKLKSKFPTQEIWFWQTNSWEIHVN